MGVRGGGAVATSPIGARGQMADEAAELAQALAQIAREDPDAAAGILGVSGTVAGVTGSHPAPAAGPAATSDLRGVVDPDLSEDFDVDVTLTVAVVGNPGVGKTSLIRRFTRGTFPQEYQRTIASDFVEKRVLLPTSSGGIDEELTFHIWDTPGGTDHKAIAKNCCRRAKACVVVFSADDRASFESIEAWLAAVREVGGPDILVVLAQAKRDLASSDDLQVPDAEVDALVHKLELRLCLCSSAEGLGARETFEGLGLEFLAQAKAAEERFRAGEARGVFQWESSIPSSGAAWTDGLSAMQSGTSASDSVVAPDKH
eukprot:gnl/TRDRNA2_/TRDRNA2_40163_c0_seq1.p1 gnl/TRDRNA2_/TRDRNA2_40163_c0~~gnl/TRDRNA2_/TRDRNA2_40163_c0_seq1.p1  ORF type:complete len:315 (+),score=51.32 gnl/TRDRNA2_/TRDRNA2_40163_c0_seq1:64-1008(+)